VEHKKIYILKNVGKRTSFGTKILKNISFFSSAEERNKHVFGIISG